MPGRSGCVVNCHYLYLLKSELYNNWLFSVDFLGYFIHDMIDIIVNGQSSNMWEVIPHHIAVFSHLSTLSSYKQLLYLSAV